MLTNLSRSTISSHMANLETRLGFKLCRRGRAGFQLTSKGGIVYENARLLLTSIDSYFAQINGLREQIVGEVVIGVVDNLITNKSNRLSVALSKVCGFSEQLRITLRIAPPDKVEDDLIRGQVDMAVTPEFQPRRAISQTPLFSETERLYCGRQHPLYTQPDAAISAGLIAEQDYVRRGYVSSLTAYSSVFSRPAIAVSYQMEGLAHFILSGRCVGFLPEDYAQYWVDRSDMRALRSEDFCFHVNICLALDERLEHSLAARYVYDVIAGAHNSPRGGSPILLG